MPPKTVAQWLLCTLLLVARPAAGQSGAQLEDLRSSSHETGGSAIAEYVAWPFSSGGTLRSILNGVYGFGEFRAGLTLNVNRRISFGIRRGPIIVERTDAGTRLNDQDVVLPSGSYEVDVPIALRLSYDSRPFRAGFSARLYSQSSSAWGLSSSNYGGEAYALEPVAEERARSDLIGSGMVGYEADAFAIGVGIDGLRVASWGSDSLESLNVQPFLRLGWHMFGGETLLENNTEDVGISYRVASLPSMTATGKPVSLVSSARTGFGSFRHRSFDLLVRVPVLEGAELVAGYRKVWSEFNTLAKSRFDRWRRSLSGLIDGDPLSGIDHSALTLGLSINLDDHDVLSPLRLVGAKIFHRNIYTAKKDFYAYNPVGTLTLHNPGPRGVNCQIAVDVTDGRGSYRSESIRIEPDEVKSVPLYLYLAEKQVEGISAPAQMNIAVVRSDGMQALSSVPLTLFDANSWDGDTWGLRYFITPNEPSVQSNAKKMFIRAMIPDSGLSEPFAEYSRVGRFLAELGEEIRYVQDPTTTLYVDHVQYPTETMRLRSGDCEDLVVFVASHLMAVGVQCALVDLKPVSSEVRLPTAGEERAVGHILLLVDTGIGTEHAGAIGLKEFEFLSRPSVGGASTLWFPLETTVLDEGFERALREGALQYYREVVEKDGVRHGTVHVYDF